MGQCVSEFEISDEIDVNCMIKYFVDKSEDK